MGTRGPSPKSKNRRARNNTSDSPVTILRFERVEQPPLPEIEGLEWCDATKKWWSMWSESPQAEHFGATDWSFLLDTALIYEDIWGHFNFDRLSELRTRVAKFGATPEDRARLRMQFAEADELDGRRQHVDETSSRDRRQGLKVIDFPQGKEA